ncbi:hypothetical protein UlMin_001043 [Ulmus minor]
MGLSPIAIFYVNFLPLNFLFSENGLVAHKDRKLIGTQLEVDYNSIANECAGIINFTLHYIADLDIPIKSGMANVSPIGRNCSQEERDEFERYDMVHNIRPKMVSVLRERFAHLNLTFSIGGQISFDVKFNHLDLNKRNRHKIYRGFVIFKLNYKIV